VITIWVELLLRIVPGWPLSNETDNAPASPVPVMVIVSPPAVEPLDGLNPVICGGAAYVYWALLLGPRGVVTVTATLLLVVPAGATAEIVVPDRTVKDDAGTEPKVTEVAPENQPMD